MLIFERNDYRQVLKSALFDKRTKQGSRATLQKLADACGVEKSYLSRVLNAKGHLNSEQLFLGCKFLGFTVEESRFCELLMQKERSENSDFQTFADAQIDLLKRKFRATESHVQANLQDTELSHFNEYFLDANMQLVHLFLGIKYFQTRPELIIKAASVSQTEFNKIIEKLLALGLLVTEGRAYIAKDANFHLPSTAPIFKFYRTNMRLKALQKIHESANDDHYCFSVLFTADEKTKQKIHADFLKFLKQTENNVRGAPKENLYQMVFDFIDWGA